MPAAPHLKQIIQNESKEDSMDNGTDRPMQGRYFCFCIAVRVNQIEVAPGVNLGVDERNENTVEDLIKYREAIWDAAPDARITIAFSHEALMDESPNFAALRQKAKEYHETYGDDVTYLLGAFFSGAYSARREIMGHVDEAVARLKAFMGPEYLPLSVVGGFIPAAVIEHIAGLGIHTVQGIIFSQYAIDNQDGDGSPCYPYYPSKEHFCKPAQNAADLIDAVVLDGWTVDFINATHAGFYQIGEKRYNSRMGCGPLETIRPFGNEAGTDIMVKTAAQMLGENYARNGEFGYACAIWELCLIDENGHHKTGVTVDTVRMFFRKLKNAFPDVRIVPYGELGDGFRRAYPDNDAIRYAFRHRWNGIGGSESGVEIEWYMNKMFRMAFRTDLRTGERRVIDFTDYTRPACEPPDADYRAGRILRNWSLLGDINQKGLRKQDAPILPEELRDDQKHLIHEAEQKYGQKIL